MQDGEMTGVVAIPLGEQEVGDLRGRTGLARSRDRERNLNEPAERRADIVE